LTWFKEEPVPEPTEKWSDVGTMPPDPQYDARDFNIKQYRAFDKY